MIRKIWALNEPTYQQRSSTIILVRPCRLSARPSDKSPFKASTRWMEVPSPSLFPPLPFSSPWRLAWPLFPVPSQRYGLPGKFGHLNTERCVFTHWTRLKGQTLAPKEGGGGEPNQPLLYDRIDAWWDDYPTLMQFGTLRLIRRSKGSSIFTRPMRDWVSPESGTRMGAADAKPQSPTHAHTTKLIDLLSLANIVTKTQTLNTRQAHDQSFKAHLVLCVSKCVHTLCF